MGLKELEEKIDEISPLIKQMAPLVAAVNPELGAIMTVANEIKGDTEDIKENQEGAGSTDAMKKLIRNYHIIAIREKAHTMIPVIKALLKAGNRSIVDGNTVWEETQTEKKEGGKIYRVTIDYRLGTDTITIDEEENHEGETSVQMMTETMQNFGSANDMAAIDLQYQSIIEIRIHNRNILGLIERVVNWYVSENVGTEDNGQVNQPKNADLSRVFGYKSLQAPINDYWLSQSLRFLVPMWFNGIQSH